MKLFFHSSVVMAMVATTSAFAFNVNSRHSRSHSHSVSLKSSPQLETETETETLNVSESTSIPAPSLNGWTPDSYLPCYGLPGAIAPTGFFDPLGFAQSGISLNEIKRNREAEIMHGRVAMVASIGYPAGESTSGPFHIVGPANDQLQQMPLAAFVALTVAIAGIELQRARIGWVEPDLKSWTKTLWTLRDNYYPGDLGFDPLNFKPTSPSSFADMQTRELQNGRLAMLGVAGMCAQELVNHRTIFETLDFYNKVYSGENPYAYCEAAGAVIC